MSPISFYFLIHLFCLLPPPPPPLPPIHTLLAGKIATGILLLPLYFPSHYLCSLHFLPSLCLLGGGGGGNSLGCNAPPPPRSPSSPFLFFFLSSLFSFPLFSFSLSLSLSFSFILAGRGPSTLLPWIRACISGIS